MFELVFAHLPELASFVVGVAATLAVWKVGSYFHAYISAALAKIDGAGTAAKADIAALEAKMAALGGHVSSALNNVSSNVQGAVTAHGSRIAHLETVVFGSVQTTAQANAALAAKAAAPVAPVAPVAAPAAPVAAVQAAVAAAVNPAAPAAH